MNNRSTQTDDSMRTGDKIRCPNSTPVERALLFEVIKKYDHIQGSKDTIGPISQKKRRDWDEIARQFNALNKGGSGTRTGVQLQRINQNYRRSFKKHNSIENSFGESSQSSKNGPTIVQKSDETGGGCYKVALTNNDEQTLTMVAPQVPSLQNGGDPEPVVVIPDVDVLIKDEPPEHNGTNLENSNIAFHADSTLGNVQDCQESLMDVSTNRGSNAVFENGYSQLTTQDDQTNRKEITTLREKYYETKLLNAQIETQCLKNKYKMDVYKFKLENKILKLQLRKIQESFDFA